MQASNLHGQSHQYLLVLSQTKSASCHYLTLHVYLEVHLPPKAAALGGKSLSWAKPRRMTKSAGREGGGLGVKSASQLGERHTRGEGIVCQCPRVVAGRILFYCLVS